MGTRYYLGTVVNDWMKDKTFRGNRGQGQELRDHHVTVQFDDQAFADRTYDTPGGLQMRAEGVTLSIAADKPLYPKGTRLAFVLKTDENGVRIFVDSRGSVWLEAQDKSYDYSKETGDKSIGASREAMPRQQAQQQPQANGRGNGQGNGYAQPQPSQSQGNGSNGHSQRDPRDVYDQPLGSAVDYMSKNIGLKYRAFVAARNEAMNQGENKEDAQAFALWICGPTGTSTMMELERGTIKFDFPALGYREPGSDDQTDNIGF